MNRRLFKPALLLAVALILFGAGIVRLFELRFTAGDVYPAYSTMRSDPLGTKALYASLEALPGLRVERNLRPLRRLLKLEPDRTAAAPTAVFYLGADAFSWPFLFTHEETERLESILQQGGQLIISFAPTNTPMTVQRLLNDRRRSRDKQERAERPDPDRDNQKNKDGKPRKAVRGFLQNDLPEDSILHWKIDFRRVDPKKEAKATREFPEGEAIAATPGEEGAEPVSWHTALDFEVDDAAAAAGWRALYFREGQPVIVSRNFGPAGGRIVLASDSYFLSNEALRAEPHPVLLASLPGPARRLIFDETHFSISENPGIMALARRFRLQWALAALGLLAGLFIWKSMVSLVPPPVRTASIDDESSNAEPGRDNAAGFLNLVRRAVPARDLLSACVTHWQAGASRAAGNPSAIAATAERLRALAEAETAKPLRRRSLAQTYRAMCEAVKPKR